MTPKESFLVWLNDVDEQAGTLRHENISRMVCSNGGWTFKGWGSLTYGASGHPIGLEQNDALDLLQAHAYFNGIDSYADFDPYDEFLPYFIAYIKAHGLEVDWSTFLENIGHSLQDE